MSEEQIYTALSNLNPNKSQGLVKVMIIGERTPQGDWDSIRAGVLQNL